MARIEDLHLLRAFEHEHELRGLLEPHARKPGDVDELLMETYLRILAAGGMPLGERSDTLSLARACAKHCAPTAARKLALRTAMPALPAIEQAAAAKLAQVKMNRCHEVHVELAAWLAQDPRHRVAFLRLSYARKSTDSIKPSATSCRAAPFTRVACLVGWLVAAAVMSSPCRGLASEGGEPRARTPSSRVSGAAQPRGAMTLHFENATLGKVIAEINRNSPRYKLALADAALASTPLGGRIVVTSPEAFASALSTLLKVRVERHGDVLLITQEMRTAAAP